MFQIQQKAQKSLAHEPERPLAHTRSKWKFFTGAERRQPKNSRIKMISSPGLEKLLFP